MSLYGYHGRILKLDLSTQTATVDTPDAKFFRLYPGAGLIGTHYLMAGSPAGIDALAPENVLTFSTGVVGGNAGPGMARFAVVAKSPLSGGVFESRCEGPFARALKGSGHDAVVLRGKLERPGYLLIDAGRWSVHDAAELWGKNTSETRIALESAHGADAAVACIGAAGENLVRFAGIVSGGAHQTQRGGLGAVMGSKNLKALVIKNPQYPQVADAAALAKLDRLFREEGITQNALNVWQKELPGFSYWLDVVVDPGYVSSRNAQAHDYAAPESFQKQNYGRYFREISACPGCANDCIKTFNTRNLTPDDRVGGTSWETVPSLALNLELQNLETFFDLNTLAMLHGMDPVSLGAVLSFAAECAERGALTREELGVEFGFGKPADENAVQLAGEIVHRKGIGNTLAEGVRRAAAEIGKGAEKYALHVKGVEMVAIEPRCQTNLALGYAVAPNGPQGDICEHDWDFDTSVGWEHTLERTWTLGIFERVPMGALLPQKVRNYKVLNCIWSATDGLGLCLYACAPTRYFRLSQMVQLVAATTGWDFSAYELMRIGERRNTLMRWYNYREGLTAADDSLSERFYREPIQTGRHRGSVLNREQFAQMIRLYYQMSGWDDDGRPTAAKLYDLGLDELAAQAG